jgi:cytochrome c peroxidase
MNLRLIGILIFVLCFLAACEYNSYKTQGKDSILELENEKIAFGKQLFFDKQLSLDNTISCATCHQPEMAFTDGEKQSNGINGQIAMRNATSLLNVKDASLFMFDGAVSNLEMQAIIPIQDVNEMGHTMGALVKKLDKIQNYKDLANKIFGRDVDAFVITRALSSYQRSLISVDSKFDQYIRTKKGLSSEEKRGWELFSSKGMCIECHSLPHFTNYKILNNGFTINDQADLGRYRITGEEKDKWSFKVPSLRNCSITGPYLHNGSVSTLKEVVKAYYYNEKSPVFKGNKNPIFDAEINAIVLFLSTLKGKEYPKKEK